MGEDREHAGSLRGTGHWSYRKTEWLSQDSVLVEVGKQTQVMWSRLTHLPGQGADARRQDYGGWASPGPESLDGDCPETAHELQAHHWNLFGEGALETPFPQKQPKIGHLYWVHKGSLNCAEQKWINNHSGLQRNINRKVRILMVSRWLRLFSGSIKLYPYWPVIFTPHWKSIKTMAGPLTLTCREKLPLGTVFD